MADFVIKKETQEARRFGFCATLSVEDLLVHYGDTATKILCLAGR
jgi:hypothetical protein